MKEKIKTFLTNTFFIVLTLILSLIIFINLKEKPISEIDTVYIPQSLVTSLNQDFSSANSEFLYCLIGEIENRTIKITSYSKAEIISSEGDSVNGICPKKTIGTIHNHNNRLCRVSYQDVYTFGFMKYNIEGIICGTNNIVFFRVNELEDSTKIKLIIN